MKLWEFNLVQTLVSLPDFLDNIFICTVEFAIFENLFFAYYGLAIYWVSLEIDFVKWT